MARAPKSRLDYERVFWDSHPKGALLAGIDEAGRGPLAGPVVAAAVAMKDIATADYLLKKGGWRDVTDSKVLTPLQRDRLYDAIMSAEDVRIGVGVASSKEVDRLNILNAAHLAMARAVENVSGGQGVEFALVDGLPVKGLPCAHTALVKGDKRSLLIAAASIVAKVERDRRMDELDAVCPGYGFIENKGYGTPQHLAALKKLGPCPEHRRSFTPVFDSMQLELFQ